MFPVLYTIVQAQSHVWLFGDPVNSSPPGSSIHGISQARILDQVTVSFSRGSSQPRDQTCVSWIAGWLFTAKPLGTPQFLMSRSIIKN